MGSFYALESNVFSSFFPFLLMSRLSRYSFLAKISCFIFFLYEAVTVILSSNSAGWCYKLNVCVSPKFSCWNPVPKMISGGGAFWRAISTLIKQAWQSSLALLPHEDTVVSSCQPRRWPEPDHASTLILDFQPLEPWEIHFCCFKPSSLLYFVI